MKNYSTKKIGEIANGSLAMGTWVYIRSEPGLWTVGFYDPSGKWHPDSDHDDREEAAKRCAWLNGSQASSTFNR